MMTLNVEMLILLLLSTILFTTSNGNDAVAGDFDLDELDVLIDYIQKTSSNTQIGFLSQSNYLSVKKILPDKTVPIIVEHEDDLIQMILNETLIAGLVTGLPEIKYHDFLHIFTSNLLALQSILMAPDYSAENPHGVTSNLSTLHLSQAINAAIASVQFKGIDLELAKKNSPKEIIQAHTCKDDLLSQFEVPNRKDANGLLRDILDKKEIRVLANGPYNWGTNDGNYLVDPPVGFFPDLLQAIIDQFQNLSGPDNQTYGKIDVKRVYSKETPFPWYKLFDGSTHISEPYFILDATYSGSGKSCSVDADCFNSSLPGNKEKCLQNFCTHPPRPRFIMFRSSCTTLGTDSKFLTKRQNSNKSRSSGLSGGIIALIVILAILAIGAISLVVFLILKERSGRPLFTRLN